MKRKTIFSDYHELHTRLESLHAGARPKWGKMNAAQMLAHVNIPLESGLGKLKLALEGNVVSRWIIKKVVFSQRSFLPNMPTARGFVVGPAQDFEFEKARLLANLKEAHTRGNKGYWEPHVAFGPLEPEEWGVLIYMHVDHHLRQFGF